jgi:hypothetical protein
MMSNGDDTLTTLKTISEENLMTPTTHGEDTLTAPIATRDHCVTTLDDITDDPCGDIDDQEQLAGSNTYQCSSWGPYQVMKRMTQ